MNIQLHELFTGLLRMHLNYLPRDILTQLNQFSTDTEQYLLSQYKCLAVNFTDTDTNGHAIYADSELAEKDCSIKIFYAVTVLFEYFILLLQTYHELQQWFKAGTTKKYAQSMKQHHINQASFSQMTMEQYWLGKIKLK